MTITIHEVTALPGGPTNIRQGSRRPKEVPFLNSGFRYMKR